MEEEKQASGPSHEPGWVFNPGATASQAPSPVQPAAAPPVNGGDRSVEWTASEFVAHHKSFGWYLALVLVGVVLAAIVYLLTKDKISTAAVLVASLVFGVAAARKPRVLAYRLDESGLAIGQKFYPYGLFRSFTIVDEGPFSSITMLPIKRFMPAYNIYYAPDDEEHIMNVLVLYLPFEQRKDGIFDSIVHRIRF